VRPHARRLAALAALCSVTVAACANTVQDQPIAHNVLEDLILAPFPVYWLGASFQGMMITEAVQDPSGAFSIKYGDCLEGGQGACVPPLHVVTSPDNSFVPGGLTLHRSARIRGAAAMLAQGGRTIEIPTGAVVVDIYAKDPRIAARAAQMIVPINDIGAPLAQLPARLPDTGFARMPLPNQMPPLLRALPLGVLH
jgi:hypothetical protein